MRWNRHLTCRSTRTKNGMSYEIGTEVRYPAILSEFNEVCDLEAAWRWIPDIVWLFPRLLDPGSDLLLLAALLLYCAAMSMNNACHQARRA